MIKLTSANGKWKRRVHDSGRELTGYADFVAHPGAMSAADARTAFGHGEIEIDGLGCLLVAMSECVRFVETTEVRCAGAFEFNVKLPESVEMGPDGALAWRPPRPTHDDDQAAAIDQTTKGLSSFYEDDVTTIADALDRTSNRGLSTTERAREILAALVEKAGEP